MKKSDDSNQAEELRRQSRQVYLSQQTFSRWLKLVNPAWRWDWPHLKFVQDALQKVTDGEIKRLMIFMPPRHGKTEQVTVRYPVYRLNVNPRIRIIQAAYNQLLSEKFSRKSRRIAEQILTLRHDRSSVEDWETEEDGGVRAVGVGGGITGQGGNLIIIDDPIKSREEAESKTYRDKLWDWYRDDLYTRCEPGGAIIAQFTRWHHDDLAGRILNSEEAKDWTVICLPALAEENDPLGRKPGEALCPERFPREELLKIQTVLGDYSFGGLYQQHPTPISGNLCDREKFQIVEIAPKSSRRVRAWDFAATEDTTSDWTVGTLLSEQRGLYAVEHVIRRRVGPADVHELVYQTAIMDGKGVEIYFEEEPGSSGKIASNSLMRKLAGWNVRCVRPSADKITRALPFLAQSKAGNVSLVKGAWNSSWLDELTVFPNGEHDDQVDSVSNAFAALTGGVPAMVIA